MDTAPKVTIEDVNRAIVGETYTILPDGRTTICQLTLDNGFTVDGHSACVSIENFNAELGNRYSREKALDKVWGYLGFRLADQQMEKLKQRPDDFVGRVVKERDDLHEKLTKLTAFLEQPTMGIPDEQKQLLIQQHKAMTEYAEILRERLVLLGSTI